MKGILTGCIGVLLFAAGVKGQDLPAPPDLYNIATGERIPGADVLKTKDFGAIAGAAPSFHRWKRWRVVEA